MYWSVIDESCFLNDKCIDACCDKMDSKEKKKVYQINQTIHKDLYVCEVFYRLGCWLCSVLCCLPEFVFHSQLLLM